MVKDVDSVIGALTWMKLRYSEPEFEEKESIEHAAQIEYFETGEDGKQTR